MKNIYKTMLGMALAVSLFTSCENDLPVYEGGASWLKFVYERSSDSIINRSFAYGSSDVKIDTVKLELQLMGEVKDYDRPFSLKQLPVGELDAVAGEHYVPFDDQELASKFYVLPANTTTVEIPVVLKRDPSLKENNYMLKFTIAESGEFACGSKERAFRTIVIADQLIQPNNWNGTIIHFFGTYGPVKHQFLIDVSGNRWDEEYVEELLGYASSDQGYLFYWNTFFKEALDEYNATHDKPLCEAGDVEITFPM